MADAGVREKRQEGKGYPLQQASAVSVLPSKTSSTPRHIPAHGGQVQKVMQMFADAPQPYVDLSTGISPFAYPAKLPDLSALHTLPEEAEEAALQHAAATAYGVSDARMVVAGGGSQSLIALLPRVLKVERACILGPTYSGHVQAWKQNGISVSEVSDFADLQLAAQQKNTVCIVCNPNNPDGRLIQASHLLDLANTCQAYGIYTPHWFYVSASVRHALCAGCSRLYVGSAEVLMGACQSCCHSASTNRIGRWTQSRKPNCGAGYICAG